MHKIHTLSYELSPPWEAAVTGWLTWLVAGGCSLPTCKTRRAHVRSVARTIASTHPADVTVGQLVGVISTPGYSIEHRRGLRSSLSAFYLWCMENGVVDNDPTKTLPKVRAATGAPKPATDDMWAAILAVTDKRTLLMARLAGEAGLRRAEVAQVHGDDLVGTVSEPELIVHGKGGKQRVVPITVTVAADVRALCPDGGFLFPGQIDGHISADRVGHIVSKIMPAGWSMHKLRHRYATRGYAGTGNLRAVQEALGHASVATTQRYTAVSSRDVRAVSEAAGTPRIRV